MLIAESVQQLPSLGEADPDVEEREGAVRGDGGHAKVGPREAASEERDEERVARHEHEPEAKHDLEVGSKLGRDAHPARDVDEEEAPARAGEELEERSAEARRDGGDGLSVAGDGEVGGDVACARSPRRHRPREEALTQAGDAPERLDHRHNLVRARVHPNDAHDEGDGAPHNVPFGGVPARGSDGCSRRGWGVGVRRKPRAPDEGYEEGNPGRPRREQAEQERHPRRGTHREHGCAHGGYARGAHVRERHLVEQHHRRRHDAPRELARAHVAVEAQLAQEPVQDVPRSREALRERGGCGGCGGAGAPGRRCHRGQRRLVRVRVLAVRQRRGASAFAGAALHSAAREGRRRGRW
mmetsp:Transcript_16717/g.54631  ORF Transcript_16717/g.54631 Transcript_16717/m.54631 type:complete len:354 (-) Transcript_16717:464-1525(-)